jgi:hypothetical protein
MLSVKLVPHYSIDINQWEAVNSTSDTGSIYTSYQFICSIFEAWEAIIVFDENSDYVAIMPLRAGSKYIFKHYLQPVLAKYWGIVIKSIFKKNNYELISYKKEVIKLMVETIPKNDYFVYNHHPNHNYLLPYYWKGYDMTAKYTFRIDLYNKDYSDIRSNEFEYQARADINKAIREGITIEIGDINDLIQILQLNNTEKNIVLDDKYFPSLIQIYNNHHDGKIVVLKAILNGELIGASMVGFYRNEAYYMYSNFDKKYKKISPLGLLTEECIKLAIDKNCIVFDFVGMMDEKIEFYWRKFGANPVTYIQISKTAYPLLFK